MNNIWFIVNVEAAIWRAGPKEDEWLVIKRSDTEENAPGALSLVGGKVELKTKEIIYGVLENTLKREVYEEVGIEIHDSMQYIESKYFISDTNKPIVDIVFLCQYKSGKPVCHDGSEVADVYWMTYAEILDSEKAPFYLKDSIKLAAKAKALTGNRG